MRQPVDLGVLDLGLDGNVVAVEKHILARRQGLARHLAGVPPGHRDQDPARRREHLEGRLQRVRSIRAGGGAPPALEQLVEGSERFARNVLVGRPDDDQQVVGAGLDLAGKQPRRRQQLEVGRRGHHDAGVVDSGAGCEPTLQLHEDNRVVVGAAADSMREDAFAHASRPLSCSAAQNAHVS